MDSLKKIRVAILCTDGFEQSELKEPRAALDAAGAITSVVSPEDEQVHGWHHGQWGSEVRVDVALDRAGEGLRRAPASRRRDESRLAPHASEGRRVREGLLRRGQAGGRDLPWPLDGHRSGSGPRPPHRGMAVAQD